MGFGIALLVRFRGLYCADMRFCQLPCGLGRLIRRLHGSVSSARVALEENRPSVVTAHCHDIPRHAWGAEGPRSEGLARAETTTRNAKLAWAGGLCDLPGQGSRAGIPTRACSNQHRAGGAGRGADPTALAAGGPVPGPRCAMATRSQGRFPDRRGTPQEHGSRSRTCDTAARGGLAEFPPIACRNGARRHPAGAGPGWCVPGTRAVISSTWCRADGLRAGSADGGRSGTRPNAVRASTAAREREGVGDAVACANEIGLEAARLAGPLPVECGSSRRCDPLSEAASRVRRGWRSLPPKPGLDRAADEPTWTPMERRVVGRLTRDGQSASTS